MTETLVPKSTFLNHYEAFKAIVGEEYIFTDAETLDACAKDETENLFFLPDIVLNLDRQRR